MDDIASLDNRPYYPLLVTGNCNNGLFAHPTTWDSLAERFYTLMTDFKFLPNSPTPKLMNKIGKMARGGMLAIKVMNDPRARMREIENLELLIGGRR